MPSEISDLTLYEYWRVNDNLSITKIDGGYTFQNMIAGSSVFVNDIDVLKDSIYDPTFTESPGAISDLVLHQYWRVNDNLSIIKIDGGYMYSNTITGESIFSSFESSEGGAVFADFHSGFYNIESGQSVKIEANKQMVNFNKLTLKGTLNINGQMIFK